MAVAILSPKSDPKFREADQELRKAEKASEHASKLGRESRDNNRRLSRDEVRTSQLAPERLRAARLGWNEALRDARSKSRRQLFESRDFQRLVADAMAGMAERLAPVLAYETFRRKAAAEGVRIPLLPPGVAAEIADSFKFADEYRRLGVQVEVPPLLKALTPEEVSS